MIDFQSGDEVYQVFSVYPHPAGNKTHGMMLGRFMVQDGKLRILEDHNGMLHEVLHDGPVGHNTAALKSLTTSSYTKVVAESDVAQGHHIGLVPKGKEPNPLGPQPQAAPQAIEPPVIETAPESYEPGAGFLMSTPPAVFDYIMAGMTTPQHIEVKGDDVFMNGQKLNKPEVDRILYTLSTGLGKLKYRKAT
jgi:hypothetical protein